MNMIATPPPPKSTAPPPGRPSAPPPPQRSTAPTTAAPLIVEDDVAFQPPRILLSAVEGFGKTTYGAYAPKPLMVMVGGETGYITLASSGLVSKCKRTEVETFPQMLALVDDLIANDRGIETLAIDTLGGLERSCHANVCRREFGGDWGEKGFGAFGRGVKLAVTDWVDLLSRLDRLRMARGVCIVMLAHAKTETFKNPVGPDYDRFVPDCDSKTWAATARWCDATLFGGFRAIVKQEQRDTGNALKKGKMLDDTERVIHTQNGGAFVAKNRYGMPPEIVLPPDPAQSWTTVWNHIRGTES